MNNTPKVPRKNASKGTAENQAIAAALGETTRRVSKEVTIPKSLNSALRAWELRNGIGR